MLKMVDGTGIIGVDMVCPLGGAASPPQPPNYDKVEVEGVGSLMLPSSLKASLERVELIGNSVQGENPSPDNPQEIKSAGKYDEASGKYLIDVKVTGIGNKSTPYKPYTEQTLTLTSDRPLTKWDKLVEQGGEYGWLYGSKSYKVTGKENFESREGYNTDSHTNRFFILSDLSRDKPILKPLAYVEKLKHVLYCYDPNVKEEGFDTNVNQFHIKLSNDRVGILSSDDSTVRTSKFSEYMKKTYPTGIDIIYMTDNKKFIPLLQEEQTQLRNLHSYNGTTHITVDSGEVPCGIKLTYRKEK